MPSQLQGMVEDLLKSQNKQTGDIATLIAKVENLERGVTGLPGELPLRDRLAAIEREIRVRKETWDRAVIDQQEIRKNRRLVWMALFTALLGFALSIAGSVLLHYMFHIAK